MSKEVLEISKYYSKKTFKKKVSPFGRNYSIKTKPKVKAEKNLTSEF